MRFAPAQTTPEAPVKPTYNVLFLCTGNSARSIMAEAILNALGGGRFRAFSAGSHPTGRVNPFALELLEKNGYSSQGARSKAWEEFTGPKAAPIDFVITVCDAAAAESCPVFPGRAVKAHWGVADPAAVEGSDADKRRAFGEALGILRRRIQRFTSLPFDSVDKTALRSALRQIAEES
ncbi:MAG: arsenate reductase ArsC [Usitatibacter sp.]